MADNGDNQSTPEDESTDEQSETQLRAKEPSGEGSTGDPIL